MVEGISYCKQKMEEDKIIKLTEVIATGDVSENLLSLRKLADEGFGIYLDDKLFKVYDKITYKIIFEGIYKKPNWLIRFRVKESNVDIENKEKCAVYCCKANNNHIISFLNNGKKTFKIKNYLIRKENLEKVKMLVLRLGGRMKRNL